MKTQKSFFLFLAFMLTLIVQPPAYARRSKIRINGWFWLNSAPKNEWKRDFKKMHEIGFRLFESADIPPKKAELADANLTAKNRSKVAQEKHSHPAECRAGLCIVFAA